MSHVFKDTQHKYSRQEYTQLQFLQGINPCLEMVMKAVTSLFLGTNRMTYVDFDCVGDWSYF